MRKINYNKNEDMKIGFFTDSYLPATHGAEVSIENSRKVLEAMGHQVYIYAPESPGYKDENPNVFRFKSISIIKNPEMRYAFDFLPINHTFKEINKLKLNIAHAHTPFSLGLLAKYISNKQLIPLIYTHHTHYPEYTKVYFKERFLLPHLAKVYSTWFSNLSNGVIAPSLKIKKLLRDYKIKRTIPIYVLPTGINLDVFKKSTKSRQNLRKKLKIAPKTKVLISVSRISKEKNLEFLIRVFAKLLRKEGDILLLILGDGPFLKQLKKIAQKLKIDQSIIFTGKVPYEKIPSYYQASDIFIFASLTETQGIVIPEAMASGLPVVALKDDAFAEIVIDNQNGFLIKEQSSNLFAQKIIKILDNPPLYRKFSDLAIKTASNFSEERMVKKLIEIYKTQIEKLD